MGVRVEGEASLEGVLVEPATGFGVAVVGGTARLAGCLVRDTRLDRFRELDVGLLVDAGGDTTRNLVGAGMWALFQHPDQLQWIAADPEARLPDAVEELLRWTSPVI